MRRKSDQSNRDGPQQVVARCRSCRRRRRRHRRVQDDVDASATAEVKLFKIGNQLLVQLLWSTLQLWLVNFMRFAESIKLGKSSIRVTLCSN